MHACPNQHLVPMLGYVVPRFGANGFLLGSNYIWGWETNRVARDLIADAGGKVLGERYLPLGETDVSRLIAEIQATRPDFVLNNLIGPSSYAFIAAYAALGRARPAFPARALPDPVLQPHRMRTAGDRRRPATGTFGRAILSRCIRRRRCRPPRWRRPPMPRCGCWPKSSRRNPDARWTDLPKAFAGTRVPRPRSATSPIDPQTQHATLPVLIGRIEGDCVQDGQPDRRRGARPLSVALRPRRDLWRARA